MTEYKKIKVRDIKVNYVTVGEGFPVLFLMGLGNTIEAYLQNPATTNAAASNGRMAILMDNRGIGGTTAGDIEDYTIETLADDAAAFLDALGIEKAHVFGFSMGGMTAQMLAVKYPEKVEKLILGCTWPGGRKLVKPEESIYEYLTVPGKGNYESVPEDLALQMVVSRKFIRENPEAAEGVRRMVASTRDDNPGDAAAFEHQQVALGKFDIYDRLPEIKAKTLVIAPRYDIVIPPANGALIATQIETSDLLWLPNSAHPMIEDTELVARKIKEFLDAE